MVRVLKSVWKILPLLRALGKNFVVDYLWRGNSSPKIRMQTIKYPYRAFLSYSHAADGKLAPALQLALHRFAKPWYRIRALQVFRDQTDLAANPKLWSTIQSSLERSEFLLLMASPTAAASKWVRRELDYWTTNRDIQKIVVVLTAGELAWDEVAADFDWNATTALPDTMRGRFQETPLFVDLRFAQSTTDLSTKYPPFLDAVATVAAALHQVAKSEIFGEDIRQHRRTWWLARSAIAGLLLLLTAAVWFGVQSDHRGNQLAEAIVQVKEEAAQKTRQRDVIKRERDEADVRAEEARRASYRAQITVALRDIGDGNTVRAKEMLNQCHPDSRGWEWRYLKHEADQSQLSIDAPARVVSAALSPRGNRFATGLNDGSIFVGSLPEGREVFRLKGHSGDVECVDFSPSGDQLVTGGEDGSIRIWDLTKGGCIRTMRSTKTSKHSSGLSGLGRVTSVRYLADGKTVVASGKPKEESLTKEDWMAQVNAKDSAESDRLFAEARNRLPKHGAIELWDAENGIQLRDVGEDRVSYKRVLSRGDNSIICGSFSGSLSVFSPTAIAGAKPLQVETTACGEIEAIAASPKASLLAVGGTGTKIEVREAGSISLLFSLPNEQDTILSIGFDDTGRRLVSGGRDGSIRVWDLDSRCLAYELRGHTRPVIHAGFTPDGKAIFSSAEKIKVWPAAKPAVGCETLDLKLGPVRSMALNADGTAVVSLHNPSRSTPKSTQTGTAGNAIITMTRLADSVEVWRSTDAGAAKAITMCDNVVVALQDDGQCFRLDPTDGKLLQKIERGEPNSYGSALCVTNGLIGVSYVKTEKGGKPTIKDLFGDRFDRLKLCDVSGDIVLESIECETRGLTALAVSPDRRWGVAGFDTNSNFAGTKTAKLAVGGALAIINFEKKEAFQVYHPEPARAVSFGSKGEWVAAGGDSSSIELLRTAAFPELTEASKAAKANHPLGRSDSFFSSFYENSIITNALGRRSLRGHRGTINSVFFAEEDRRLLSSSGDGTIRIWDISSSDELLILSGHQGAVYQVLFDAHHDRVISCGEDGTIRIWKGGEAMREDAEELVSSAIQLIRSDKPFKVEEAIRCFTAAIELFRRGVKEEGLPLYQERLCVTLGNRASAYATAKQFDRCNADDDAAVMMAEKLMNTEHGWRYRELLAGQLVGRAGKLASQNANDKAANDLKRASDLYKDLIEVEGRDDLRLDLARCHETTGTLFNKQNQLTKAIEAYSRAVALIESSANENVDQSRTLAMCLHNRAIAYARSGRKEDGIKDIDRAIATKELLVKAGMLDLAEDLVSSKKVRLMLTR
jgi:WD40 repeat protein